jgi:hypothetical protein
MPRQVTGKCAAASEGTTNGGLSSRRQRDSESIGGAAVIGRETLMRSDEQEARACRLDETWVLAALELVGGPAMNVAARAATPTARKISFLARSP